MENGLMLNGQKTIQHTLFTAKLMDGFWERWKVHGVEDEEIQQIRQHLFSLEQWHAFWESSALLNRQLADSLEALHMTQKAEMYYRLSGLYYYLNQWIYPNQNASKEKWFLNALEMFRTADSLSPIQTVYESLVVDGYKCFGRIRIPHKPIGCVIIINPIDSSKEELFTYESDFIKANFVTVSFDGPGQGETFAFKGMKGSTKRWMTFIDTVIGYATDCFPRLSLYLFGTSSGATWAVYGSGNPKVTKAVSVSPAIKMLDLPPSYFKDRLEMITEANETTLPNIAEVEYLRPVYIFHGAKDVMVPKEHIQDLYERLPYGKQYTEYVDEGHCCNNQLNEVRRRAIEWFLQ